MATWHYTICLLFASMLTIMLGCDRPVASPAKPVVIAISGDTAGWLTPCGCTSNQSGGMPRRGSYLTGLRASSEVIYLDAGGAPGGTSSYHQEKFEAILAGEKAMGIAAHNLGGPELALGDAQLRSLLARSAAPFVSANTVGTDGQPIAPAVREVVAGGRTFLIVGVVSPKFATSSIKVSDPRAAVLDAVMKNPAKSPGRGVIVLAYLPDDELNALAAGLPEADAVIGGPTGQAMAPKQVGPVLMASATNKGKFIVRLDPQPAEKYWRGAIDEISASITDSDEQTQNVRTFLTRLEARDFPAVETGVIEPLPPGTPASFRISGSASCASCHIAESNSWHFSKHSYAFDTLKSKGFQADASCQSCHSTGFAMPGGFEKLSTSAAMFGVGCESCHGPSAAHAKDPKMRTPWLAADQCKRCHDHENSPKFDYATYWPRIAHGKRTGAAGQ